MLSDRITIKCQHCPNLVDRHTSKRNLPVTCFECKLKRMRQNYFDRKNGIKREKKPSSLKIDSPKYKYQDIIESN